MKTKINPDIKLDHDVLPLTIEELITRVKDLMPYPQDARYSIHNWSDNDTAVLTDD